MKLIGISMAAAVGLVTACALYGVQPAGVAKSRHFTVELKPRTSGANNDLEIKTGPQGHGKAGKKDGYVGFGEDEAGSIIFSLKGENLGDMCEPNGEADWVITRIELSASGDSTTEKGQDFGTAQPAWLKDAFPDVILGTGVVHEAGVGEAPTTVSVRDANAQEGQKYIFYRVTATECAAPHATVATDPMVDNTGK